MDISHLLTTTWLALQRSVAGSQVASVRAAVERSQNREAQIPVSLSNTSCRHISRSFSHVVWSDHLYWQLKEVVCSPYLSHFCFFCPPQSQLINIPLTCWCRHLPNSGSWWGNWGTWQWWNASTYLVPKVHTNKEETAGKAQACTIWLLPCILWILMLYGVSHVLCCCYPKQTLEGFYWKKPAPSVCVCPRTRMCACLCVSMSLRQNLAYVPQTRVDPPALPPKCWDCSQIHPLSSQPHYYS